MEKKLTIANKELFCILVNTIIIKMFFIYPRQMVINSGNAAWIQCIFISIISILIYMITINIYKKAGNICILDLSEKLGGKAFKIIVGLLLTIVLLANSSATMRALPESIKTVLLPLTPMRYLLILLSIAVGIGAYIGIHSISIIHSIFIPIVTFVFITLILLLIPYMDVTNLFPIFGKGTYNIFVTGLDSIGLFSDIIILYIIMPYCTNFNSIKRTGLYAMITSSLFSTAIVFIYNIIYAYPSSQDFIFPVYQMTRLIKIGDFFQRLESFYEFIWSISIMLYSALYLFVVCHIWEKMFNLKYYKELIFPFVFIFIASTYLPASTLVLTKMGKLMSLISIPVCLILPAVLAILYRIKTKNTNKNPV